MTVAPGGIGPSKIVGTSLTLSILLTSGESSGAGLPSLKIRSVTRRWFRLMS
jgi:hypothetical protein